MARARASFVIRRGVRYCGYCGGREGDGKSHRHCRTFAKCPPSAGAGYPSWHDCPLTMSDSALHRYIDLGGAARDALDAQRTRNRAAYDFYLQHRSGGPSAVIDLGVLITAGRAVRRT